MSKYCILKDMPLTGTAAGLDYFPGCMIFGVHHKCEGCPNNVEMGDTVYAFSAYDTAYGHPDPCGPRGRQGGVPREYSEKAEEYQKNLKPPYDADDIISAYECGMMAMEPEVEKARKDRDDAAYRKGKEDGRDEAIKELKEKYSDGKELLYVCDKSYKIGYRDAKLLYESKLEALRETIKLIKKTIEELGESMASKPNVVADK